MEKGFLRTSWLWNGTLLGTHVSPFQGTVEWMIFLLPRRDMLVPWRLLEILANWYRPLRNLTPDGIFYRSRGIPPRKKSCQRWCTLCDSVKKFAYHHLIWRNYCHPIQPHCKCLLPIKTNGTPPRIFKCPNGEWVNVQRVSKKKHKHPKFWKTNKSANKTS